MEPPTLTLAVVGDRGVGKTKLVDWFVAVHDTQKPYGMRDWPPNQARVRPKSDHRTVDVRLRECLCVDAQGVIVMFDRSSMLSLRSVPRWVREVRRMKPLVPIVVVGNETKEEPSTVSMSPEQIAVLYEETLPYFEISMSHGRWFNWKEKIVVLEWFMQWLFKDESVTLEDCRWACSMIPDISLTEEEIARIEAQNAAPAAAVPLPEEDDDL